jgi:hypothetical protein
MPQPGPGTFNIPSHEIAREACLTAFSGQCRIDRSTIALHILHVHYCPALRLFCAEPFGDLSGSFGDLSESLGDLSESLGGVQGCVALFSRSPLSSTPPIPARRQAGDSFNRIKIVFGFHIISVSLRLNSYHIEL